MNDSFLEDLELVPAEQKTGTAVNHAERYITTRQHPQSVASELCTDRDELEALINQQRQLQQHKSSSASAVILKTSSGKKILDDNSPSREMYSKRKQVDPKDRIQLETKKSTRECKNSTKLRISDKKGKINDDKLKRVENVDRADNPKSSLALNDGKKRTTGSRENSRLSDGSTKENSRPSDSSAETVVSHPEPTKEWRRISSENSKKKGEINEDRIESVAMLNAIKEIVSGYTKMESNKIMKMMQDHYINSQANFMKQLLIMTDDIRHSHPENDSSRIQTLIQENSRLLENVSFLKNRVEELQKVVEITDKIRQENTALKLKILDLEK